MSGIMSAVISLCAIAAVCGIVLVVASKYMSVPQNEKFPAIRACLPGANCGACGYAGCDGYANALAAGEEEKTNKCIAGGQEVAKAVAETMGLNFEAVVEVNAFIHCRGDCLNTAKRTEFQGARSCAAAKLLFGSDGACHYGCIGYGDCASVCPENAINIINGIAHINDIRCMGCGACARTCPQGIIEVLPKEFEVEVSCSNHDKGPAVKKACAAGCIGCTLCVRQCEFDAITVTNNIAHIDYEKCTQCGKCAEKCPAKVILPGKTA